MEEKNLNFDEVIDRRNTDCLKFDFAETLTIAEGGLTLTWDVLKLLFV